MEGHRRESRAVHEDTMVQFWSDFCFHYHPPPHCYASSLGVGEEMKSGTMSLVKHPDQVLVLVIPSLTSDAIPHHPQKYTFFLDLVSDDSGYRREVEEDCPGSSSEGCQLW
jgi:hypothetical protein